MHVAQTVAMAALVPLLLLAAWRDARTGRIPNRLTYAGVLVGLVGWAAWGVWAGGLEGGLTAGGWSLIACLVAFLPTVVAFALGGLGGGDVKLAAAVGAVSGDPRVALATLVYAVVVSAGMAVFVVVRQGLVRRTLGRLASVAMQAAARVRPTIPDEGPKIPFGVALAVGGLVAGVEQLLGWPMPWTGVFN